MYNLVLFFTIYCHRIQKKSAWNHNSWHLVDNMIDKWKGQPRNLVKELLGDVMQSKEGQRRKICSHSSKREKQKFWYSACTVTILNYTCEDRIIITRDLQISFWVSLLKDWEKNPFILGDEDKEIKIIRRHWNHSYK